MNYQIMENNNINISKISYYILFPDEQLEEETPDVVSESELGTHSSNQLSGDSNFLKLVKATRRGLSYKSFYRAQKLMNFTQQDWAEIFHISPRTIDRLKKDKKHLNSTLSEKLIEVTLLYDYGIEVFGSIEKFSTWLNRPSLYLGNVEPKSLLDTHQGIEAVKSELSRIDYGILA